MFRLRRPAQGGRYESELVVAAARTAFILLVMLTPAYMRGPGTWRAELWVSAVLAALYNVALLISYWNGVGFRWQRQTTIAIDLILVTFWVYLTFSTGPPLSSLYSGLIIIAAIWFGMVGALITAGAAAVLYGGLVWLAPPGIETLSEVLSWRLPILFVLALLIGYLVEAHSRERERWKAAEELYDREREERQRMAEVYEHLVVRPASQTLPGLDVGLRFRPAGRAGAGDYYDVMKVDEGYALVIADVAGTYAPGITRVLQLKYACWAAAQISQEPKEVLERLNRMLFSQLQPDQFISICYLHVVPETGKLVYASAGHEPPVIVRAASGQVERLEKAGVVLGVLPDVAYQEEQVHLEPGDLLLLYTDGLSGATSEWGEEFGARRVEAIAVSGMSRGLAADEIAQRVYAEVMEFSRGGRRVDDVTVAAVRLAR